MEGAPSNTTAGKMKPNLQYKTRLVPCRPGRDSETASGQQHKSSTTQPSTEQVNMVAIVVQPPVQTSTNTQLYPAVVAKTQITGAADTSYLFAMAVLLDYNGNVLEGELGGTTVVTGMSMPDSTGGSGGEGSSNSLFFVFSDLHISWPGTFSIRIDIYYVDYADPQGAQLLEQTETRLISVCDDEVDIERPNSAERVILRRLRDYGYTFPSSPA